MSRVSSLASLGFALFISAAAAAFFLFIDLDYIRWVDNDPLTDAVRVARFERNEIQLDDGRIIELFEPDDQFKQELQRPDPRVEVVQSAGSDLCRVYFRKQRFICGLTAAWLEIPLIPRDTPRYEKSFGQPGTLRKQQARNPE